MNVAQLVKSSDGKWNATFNGHILAASSNKEYVIRSIKSGFNNRARKFNVTDVQEFNQVVDAISNVLIPSDNRPQFNINERFEILEDFAIMVGKGTAPSLLVVGEGGLGKTFTVNKALRSIGLYPEEIEEVVASDDEDSEDEDEQVCKPVDPNAYVVVKGYSSPKGLYRLLYENRNRRVIFDDCDSIFKNANALNILKGALDSYDRRIVSWNAENMDIPSRFEFTGSIIFITNQNLENIDGAIRSRALCVNLSMTRSEIVERMTSIVESGTFMPDVSMEIKRQALSVIDEYKEVANHLSLRELISVTKIIMSGTPNWKRSAAYALTSM